jgi:hypothetical protein
MTWRLLIAFVLTVAAVLASARTHAYAAEGSANVISFKNRTCGELTLTATGNDACFGFGGCALTIPAGETKRYGLREGVRPEWAIVKVAGHCPVEEGAELKTELKGECAIDLTRAFKGTNYRPGIDTPLPAMPGSPVKPQFEELPGLPAPGAKTASIVLDTGICEVVDGKEICEVSCDVN